MVKFIRSAVALVIVLTLMLGCVPMAFAAATDLTYQEYLKMTTEEQIAFREQFASTAEFKSWYLAAKQEYEDSQNKVVIGDGNSVDLGEILNPTLASGTCGDALSWSLSKDGVLTISGSGSIYDYETSSAPWSEYVDSILKVELPSGLTSIGENAFYGCSAITDVYYAGTPTQWAEVSVANGNDPLSNATLHTTSPVLTQIVVKTVPAKTDYAWGEELDTTGLTLTLTYHDGSQEDISSGYQTSGFDPKTPGVQTVTVTYLSKTAAFDVTVAEPELNSISIQTTPTKSEYFVGDELDTTGLVLKLTFADGSVSTVDSGFTTSGFDSTTAGEKTVTVTYLGKSTTFAVTVQELSVTGISVKTNPTKINYWLGEELDTTGLVLTVTYNNGSTADISTDFTTSGFDSETTGTKTVTVTYQEQTAAFDVTVLQPDLTGISVHTLPTKLEYWVGENLDTAGLVLTATYEDSSTAEIKEGFQCTGFDPNTAGTQTITVSFGDFTTTFDVTVTLGGECGDDLIWTMDANGVLTITGSGDMYDYDLNSTPWDAAAVTDIALDPAATSIGSFAFAGCAALTEFTIPAGVTVGEGAFAYCDNLSAITAADDHSAYYTDSNGALYNKDKSVLIQVPGGFSDTFTVPSSVTTIGNYAFAGCSKLTAVQFTGSSTITGGFTPRGEEGESSTATTVEFGNSNITSIGSYAFAGCSSLTKINLPIKVTAINEGTFANCTNLAHITIPSGITTIGDSAFSNCTALSSIVFAGSKSGWTGVTKGSDNEILSTSPVLYKSDVKLTNAAPTLYDNIAMNYKANKTLFDEMGITDPYLIVSFNGVETTLTDYTVSEDGTQYVFTFYNIAPNQMDDTLTATLYVTYANKEYTGATLEYSVATYCYRMLNNSAVVNNAAYAELRTLLVDLLHYGAAAQTFTGYEGALVNARLTETHLTWGTAADPTLENKTVTNYATVTNPSAAWASVGLVLEDAVTMRFKFTTADITGLTVKITSETNAEGWVISADEFLYEESTGRYYVDFGGLHAGQMRECVYVTVYNGDTAISNTLQYSIESYAYRYANNTTYPTLAALVKAMMRYGDAAYNFAN